MSHETAVIQGQNLVVSASHQADWGDHEDVDGGAQLFAPPKGKRRIRKAKDWLERAKLVIAAARDRATETAQQQVVPSMKRSPTVLQRRLAARLRARS